MLTGCGAAEGLDAAAKSVLEALAAVAADGAGCRQLMAAGGAAEFKAHAVKGLVRHAGLPARAALAQVTAALTAPQLGAMPASATAEAADAAAAALLAEEEVRQPQIAGKAKVKKKAKRQQPKAVQQIADADTTSPAATLQVAVTESLALPNAKPEALINDLAGTLHPANVLCPTPKLPSDEVVNALAADLATSPGDGSRAARLTELVEQVVERCVQQSGHDATDADTLVVPAFGLLMRVEHPKVAAVALCAAALMFDPGEDSQASNHETLPATWTQLPQCVGAALARRDIVEAARAEMPSSVGRAALFALASAQLHTRNTVLLRHPELAPALHDVLALATEARTNPAARSSVNRTTAAVSFVSVLGNPICPPAVRKRWLHTPASLIAVAELVDTAAVVYVAVLLDEADRFAGQDLRSVASPVFQRVHSLLEMIMGWYVRMGIRPGEAPEVPAPAARHICSAVLRLLRVGTTDQAAGGSPACATVHPEQRADIALFMFGDWAGLMAAALAALPSAEHRSHLDAVAKIGQAALAAAPPPASKAGDLLLPLLFQCGVVRAMVLDGQQRHRVSRAQYHIGAACAYLANLLLWIHDADGADTVKHDRFRIRAARRVEIHMPDVTIKIDSCSSQMAWMARSATRFLARQLTADFDLMAAAGDTAGREAVAVMAESLEIPTALAASLELEAKMFAAQANSEEPGFLPAKEASIAAAMRMLCRIAEAQLLAPKPQLKPYCLALDWLARAAFLCCLLESGAIPRLPAALNYFAGAGRGGVGGGSGAGRQSASSVAAAAAAPTPLGRQHAELCGVFSRLLAREEDIAPGATAANDWLRPLLRGMQAAQVKAAHSLPEPVLRAAAAAFCTNADAVAAVARHGVGCRQLLAAGGRHEWRPQHVVVPESVLAGDAAVAAAIQRVSDAVEGRAPAPAPPAADPALAAEAAAAELLQEEERRKQEEAKRQARAAKKARQKAKKKGLPVGNASASSAADPAVAAAATAAGSASDLEQPAAVAAAAVQLQGAMLREDHLAAATAEAPAPAEEEAWAICPLTQVRMQDPVLAADGESYEREAIKAWLIEHDTSPVTGARLEHKDIIPNHALRSLLSMT